MFKISEKQFIAVGIVGLAAFVSAGVSAQDDVRYNFAWDPKGPCWSTAVSSNGVPEPEACPTGYVQSRAGAMTANCTNGQCPCTNWMDCAHHQQFSWGCAGSATPWLPFKVRECKKAPGVLGANNRCFLQSGGGLETSPPVGEQLPMFFLSLHHGIADNYIPLPSEIRSAAQKTARVWPEHQDLVVAIAASPCNDPRRGYWGFAGEQFTNELNSAYGGHFVSVRHSLACDFRQGNTSLLAGENWNIVDARNESYPSNIAGTEGVNFGIYKINHKRLHRQIAVVTGTVESADTSKRKLQITWLLQRGRQISRQDKVPTFVGGDFNFMSGDAQDPSLAPVVSLMASTGKRLSFWNDCSVNVGGVITQYKYDTAGLIHYELYNAQGSVLNLKAYILDPDHSSGSFDQPASQIFLPGIVPNHTLVGALFAL